MDQKFLLSKVLAPEFAVLLVVDVQNDFCHPRGALGQLDRQVYGVDEAVANLKTFAHHAKAAGVQTIYTRMVHSPRTDSEAWRLRTTLTPLDICRAGTWGAKFYCLSPQADEYVIDKHRYSAFLGTNLGLVLRALGCRTVIIGGVATNVCVEATARDACMNDYFVVVLEDCVAATSQFEHRAGIENIAKYFGRVMASSTVRKLWSEL